MKAIKVKACGATGLADALAYALARKQGVVKNPYVIPEGRVEIMPKRPNVGKSFAFDQISKAPNTAVALPDTAPVPLLERRKREENANRITKHCNVIKRIEPRLLMELLQDFGSIEGLSRPKQEELIKRLEGIRKTYRI